MSALSSLVCCSCRELPAQHPARDNPGFASWLGDARLSASLGSFREYKRLSNGGKGALQYSDLHGIPCILILCEKGRMGDTFPETFCCLDLRIRTAGQLSVFVQEFGRLCRYPSTTELTELSRINSASCQHPGDQDRVSKLEQALCYAHCKPGLDPCQSMHELIGEPA